jgi:hypothetical protein
MLICRRYRCLVYKRAGGGGGKEMKRRVLAIIMAGLMLLTVFGMCFTASAGLTVWGRVRGVISDTAHVEAGVDSGSPTMDAGLTVWGRVRGVISGTVHVVAGVDSGSSPIKAGGFYSVFMSVKITPVDVTVTARTNRGTRVKVIEDCYGGTYHINFNFYDGIVSRESDCPVSENSPTDINNPDDSISSPAQSASSLLSLITGFFQQLSHS